MWAHLRHDTCRDAGILLFVIASYLFFLDSIPVYPICIRFLDTVSIGVKTSVVEIRRWVLVPVNAMEKARRLERRNRGVEPEGKNRVVRPAGIEPARPMGERF